MKNAIIIPARYSSKRLPGKPLIKISGVEMISRVWEIASKVKQTHPDTYIIVATDNVTIKNYCEAKNINVLMTSDDCETGTDRVIEAAKVLKETFPSLEFVINLQGDNPLCPSWFIEALISAYMADSSIQIVTPVVQLSWEALSVFRDNKKSTPFSGTSVIISENNNAILFSKNIIPAIRNEDVLRKNMELSPVFRHIGIYGYSFLTLNKIGNLSPSKYEIIEGLEQLRFIENGIPISCVNVTYRGYDKLSYSSGIDTIEDVLRAEKLIDEYGEIL